VLGTSLGMLNALGLLLGMGEMLGP